MKQNLGLPAIVIAALVALRASAPVSQTDQPASPQTATSQAADGDSSQTKATIEGPWLATQAFFHSSGGLTPAQVPDPTDSKSTASIPDCSDSTNCSARLVELFGIPESKKGQIQFLIATVPDPLHSRLALFTDTSIQAMEDAAQTSGWIFATQWLPWTDATNSGNKDLLKRRKEREAMRLQEEQPGILIFRRPNVAPDHRDEVLIVFVVGETPTAGVNPGQFQLARTYMRSIHEPMGKVRILGPTFSGSFYSLADLLKDDRLKYAIRSGTATNTVEAAILDPETFRGTTASSIDQECSFAQILEQLGVDTSRAAKLVEDESAYGEGLIDADQEPTASANDPCGAKASSQVRVFHFPRDISHLRNSYKDAVAASKSAATAAPDIEFSIKDPDIGEDSIPLFSSSQSPLSQNGVVSSIANSIQRDRIRLVWIVATNVLDVLFLSDVLKRQCPDTRLLVNDADVLLAQAARREPLSGTLVLASYPGFSASTWWRKSLPTGGYAAFSNATGEGVYNATILLLNGCETSEHHECGASKLLADYSWGNLQHPPTWLLTLDRQGLLPVSVYPGNAKTDRHAWFQDVRAASQGGERQLQSPSTVWNVLAVGIALAALALSLWSFWISKHQKCEMDARFSLFQLNRQDAWRRFHLFGFLLILLSAEFTVGFPALRFRQPTRFVVLLAISALVVLTAACRALTLQSARVRFRLAAAAAILGTATFMLLWAVCCYSNDYRSLFFALRARELRFGSSPAWPIVISLAALGLFEFVQVTRLYVAGSRRPDIITLGLSSALAARMSQAHKDFNGAVMSTFGLRFAARIRRSREPIVVALMLCLTGVALGYLFEIPAQLRSIDTLDFNVLALGLELLVVVLLLLTCLHLRLLWRSLQSFLGAIGTLPIARSFGPIDRSGADRPIWVRRMNLQSVDIHVQAVYVLHNMTAISKDALALHPFQAPYITCLKARYQQYVDSLKELLAVEPSRKRQDTLELIRRMRSVNKELTKNTFQFLQSCWAQSPIIAPDASEDDHCKEPAAATEKSPHAASTPDQFVGLAQRFVALHYSSFILYGVRQIQNLLLFLSSGFVLLMLSLNCYSIQAPRFTGRLLMGMFLIIGTVTVSCLVGLEKDPILSRMAGTEPGKLNGRFYLKIATYGALPALSLVAAEFPSISNFLLSWVQPTIEALK